MILYFVIGIFSSFNAEDMNTRRRVEVYCSAGTYSATSKAPCTSCDPGFWSLDAAYNCNQCRTCQPGSYVSQYCASDTPKICTQCPAGEYSNVTDIGSCDTCEGDTWSKPGMTECIDCITCPPGTYQRQTCSATTPRACQECDVGFYSNISDALQCTACPDGTYSSTKGAVDCIPCAGVCEPGHFIAVECTTTTNKRCEECDAGTYASQNDSSVCTQCPDEWWSTAGESTCHNCTDCYPGHQILQDCSATNDRRCQECPAGTYEMSENSASCSACASGVTWSPPGATECTDCLVCQPGHYQNVTCTVDEAGVCALCPAGTYASGTAETSCTTCSSTSWSVAGSAACTTCETCPAGTYNSVECTTTTARQCTNCPPGTYTDTTDQSVCTDCGADEYADEGAITCETCTTCEIGHFITANCTNSTDRMCGECDAGYYAASANSFICDSCTESVNWSLDGASACETCTQCNPGHYKSGNCTVTMDTQCSECDAGTYATGIDEIKCSTCPTGTWSLDGASSCTNCTTCEPGFYETAECDGTRDRGCSQCPAGNYTSLPDQTSCPVCEDESWSFSGADSCTPCVTCEPGFYAYVDCDAAQPRVCRECGPGNYTTGQNELECAICDDGYFSLAGSSECILIM